jgi:hypothetical protein
VTRCHRSSRYCCWGGCLLSLHFKLLPPKLQLLPLELVLTSLNLSKCSSCVLSLSLHLNLLSLLSLGQPL